ncbi:MAG: thiamine pyrophosphate-dependent dehydrogenase E1 component subunit alpha [Chloroflexi bacterium]|nr:thiamine pyrophosphate-dependent dehydrogenase E1 component subunit alpha [Chloroflexota bacterium]
MTRGSTLSRQHEVVGLAPAALLELYSLMTMTRLFDERVWTLNRQGRIAIAASCQGHEAAQMGSALALRRGHDLFFIYYRDLAVSFTLGVTPREMMLSFYGKAGEPFSGGRQVFMHGCYPTLRIYNPSNVVGAHLPQAAGAALATKMRREDAVVIAYFGDGGASPGDCHEAMNFAGVHRLPIIFFCENNGWAISVPQRRQMAIEDIAQRACGYGFPGVTVDGTDLLAVYQATREAAARARRGEGPTLIEAKVARLMPHTTDDSDLYRGKEYVEALRVTRDPLQRLKEYLRMEGAMDQSTEEDIVERARQAVEDATAYAETAPWPDPAELSEHVQSSERQVA